MPWEKAFDIDEATDRATKIFWKKGFEATSMADLTKAMGINKGSLYNAFGSKQKLFDRALERYDRTTRAERLAALREMDNGAEAIAAFFDGFVAQARAQPECLGCFVVNTAQDLPNQTPQVVALIRNALSDIETFFRDMIVKGQGSGDIPASVQPDATAKALLSMLVGLRLLSRGAVDPATFGAIRDGAVRLLHA